MIDWIFKKIFDFFFNSFKYEVLLDIESIEFYPCPVLFKKEVYLGNVECILTEFSKERIKIWCKNNNISSFYFRSNNAPKGNIQTLCYRVGLSFTNEEKRAYEKCRPRLMFKNKSDAILFKLSF